MVRASGRVCAARGLIRVTMQCELPPQMLNQARNLPFGWRERLCYCAAQSFRQGGNSAALSEFFHRPNRSVI